MLLRPPASELLRLHADRRSGQCRPWAWALTVGRDPRARRRLVRAIHVILATADRALLACRVGHQWMAALSDHPDGLLAWLAAERCIVAEHARRRPRPTSRPCRPSPTASSCGGSWRRDHAPLLVPALAQPDDGGTPHGLVGQVALTALRAGERRDRDPRVFPPAGYVAWVRVRAARAWAARAATACSAATGVAGRAAAEADRPVRPRGTGRGRLPRPAPRAAARLRPSAGLKARSPRASRSRLAALARPAGQAVLLPAVVLEALDRDLLLREGRTARRRAGRRGQ